MAESITRVVFDITWNVMEYVDCLQANGVGLSKPIVMDDLYDQIIGWAVEFWENYSDSDDYYPKVIGYAEEKAKRYLLSPPSEKEAYANKLGRLVLLAKGDRTMRAYAKESGCDVAIISKIVSGKYVPKSFRVLEKLTSDSAKPRNGITAIMLERASIEVQKEMLTSKLTDI
jgi:hypothetical protein